MEVLFSIERKKIMRYGAVDIGTNSCRLLIADKNAQGKLVTIHKELETTRIGEGINKSRLLNEAAIARTLLCLSHFRDIMREYKVNTYRTVATNAVREAGNRNDFVKRVRSQVGIEVEIVSGTEEASLSYNGVVKGLETSGDPLVADLGGGSTEFICPDQNLLLSISVGAVRAAEADMNAAQIIEKLNPLLKYQKQLKNKPLIMVGGTATSLVAIKKGMAQYDPERVHGAVLSRGEIGDLYNMLEKMPLALRRRLPGLQPERADIIHKGALIILVILEVLGHKEIIVSDTDILQGIIWSMLDGER
jgi:exopolyphosphatase/guanosine-5'-triphosphate,3'-diphosphate pyrophosphatase